MGDGRGVGTGELSFFNKFIILKLVTLRVLCLACNKYETLIIKMYLALLLIKKQKN